MLIFLPGVLLAAALTPSLPSSIEDLEQALRATASLTYGVQGSRFGASYYPELPAERSTPPRAAARAARPAELLLQLPIRDVPDELLVATLIAGATGGRDPVEVAKELLGEVSRLEDLSHGDFTRRVKGLGKASQARLTAMHELARRSAARTRPPERVRDAASAWRVLRLVSAGDYEVLSALYLDRAGRVLGVRELSTGTDSLCLVDPKKIFREALSLGASGVVLGHQHPSGDPTPSSLDLDVTNRVQAAGNLLGIQLMDHIVITPQRFVSLRETGAF
jgi:DNA repair protein RadC